MKQMKRKLLLGVFLFVTASLLLIAAAASRQASVSGKLIRLHILADCDTETAQADKLAVRDTVLDLLERQSWQSREEAASWLRAHTQELEDAARDCLTGRGCADPVSVRLVRERYPTRHYDTFSLPAGEYLSLQVRIGSAEGQNWWCVIYPDLCLPAAQDALLTAAVSAGFTDEDFRFITADTGEIQIKFKVLEWLDALRGSEHR